MRLSSPASLVRIAALALAAVLPARAAWAQKPIPETVRMMEPHLLRVGETVRAWTEPDRPPVLGTIVAVSADSVTITTAQEAVLLSLPRLERMELRRAHTHARRGALIGAGLGLLASAFIVTEEVFGRHIGGWERAAWTAGFAVGGAGIGVGVARVARTVSWQPVDLVTLKPQPRAASAGPALRFSWTVRF